MARMWIVLLFVVAFAQDFARAWDDQRIQFESPFGCFKEARSAFADRDSSRLQKCFTTACQDALVVDLAIACALAPDAAIEAGKPVDKFAAAKIRLKAYQTEQATLWAQEKYRGYLASVLAAYGVETSRVPQDLQSDEGLEQLAVECKRVGISDDDPELERIIEHVVEDLTQTLEKSLAEYEGAYANVLFLTLVNRQKLDQARRVWADLQGGFQRSFFVLKDFVDVTNVDYEPFVAMTGTLNEVTTSADGTEATGIVVVRRDGKRLLWQVDFVKHDERWQIDSLGYGDRLEPVFDGKFVQRPLGKWELESNHKKNDE